jgi:biopolymer transport protein ExbB
LIREIFFSTAFAQEAAESPEGMGAIGNFFSGIVTKFNQGGPMMWALLLAAVFGVMFIILKAITLSMAKINAKKFMNELVETIHKDGIKGAIELCQRTRGPVSSIISAGLDKYGHGHEVIEKAMERAGVIELAILERGMVVLSTVANVAPVLGFLGTVTGMINAFNAIAEAGEIDPKIVASGISEALITTATGLMIAAPVQAFHNFFATRIDAFIVEIEESAARLMDALVIFDEKKAEE